MNPWTGGTTLIALKKGGFLLACELPHLVVKEEDR
jgi:hypothetical protein